MPLHCIDKNRCSEQKKWSACDTKQKNRSRKIVLLDLIWGTSNSTNTKEIMIMIIISACNGSSVFAWKLKRNVLGMRTFFALCPFISFGVRQKRGSEIYCCCCREAHKIESFSFLSCLSFGEEGKKNECKSTASLMVFANNMRTIIRLSDEWKCVKGLRPFVSSFLVFVYARKLYNFNISSQS